MSQTDLTAVPNACLHTNHFLAGMNVRHSEKRIYLLGYLVKLTGEIICGKIIYTKYLLNLAPGIIQALSECKLYYNPPTPNLSLLDH